METRRDFFKRAAALGNAGITGILLASIEKAAAIDPPKASTFLDAEHVVILMQENRSFDHVYGKLRGAVPLGLGYRVPMIIASPWSRGGFVCSQVFDHTSVLQLLERVMQRRAKGTIQETNISGWRRAVCGDPTAAFQPAQVERASGVKFLEDIYQAQFKPMPNGFQKIGMRRQEPGVRPSSALPYEIYAEGVVSEDRKRLELTWRSGAAGARRFTCTRRGCIVGGRSCAHGLTPLPRARWFQTRGKWTVLQWHLSASRMRAERIHAQIDR